jgi:hypothetical protein
MGTSSFNRLFLAGISKCAYLLPVHKDLTAFPAFPLIHFYMLMRSGHIGHPLKMLAVQGARLCSVKNEQRSIAHASYM